MKSTEVIGRISCPEKDENEFNWRSDKDANRPLGLSRPKKQTEEKVLNEKAVDKKLKTYFL